MRSEKVTILIPARLKSTRLPEKVIADINGKPLVWYTFNNTSKCSTVQNAMVLTDSQKVVDILSPYNIPAYITPEDLPNGTARIAHFIKNLPASVDLSDLIINVQADEPFVTCDMIEMIADMLLTKECPVATLVRPIKDIRDFHSKHVVKVVLDAKGKALYFSRAPIPFPRDKDILPNAYGHIGMYGYTIKALEIYASSGITELEEVEKLEQLRFLYLGIPICTSVVDYKLFGVDTPEDLENIRNILKAYVEL